LNYVYLWQKQYEKALAAVERAVAVDPSFWTSGISAHLAFVLSHVDRVEEALQVVEQTVPALPPLLHKGFCKFFWCAHQTADGTPLTA
jgi:hypothetical protein